MRREGGARGVKKGRWRRGRVTLIEAENKKRIIFKDSKKKKRGGEKEVMNCETKLLTGG